MPIVACSECGAQISTRAAACPSCGAPAAAPDAERPGVVTTQQTAKRFKRLQLVALLLCSAGTVSCVAQEVGAMSALWAAGLGLYFWARFGAWWSHG